MIKAIILSKTGKDDTVLAGNLTIEEIRKYQARGWIFERETAYNKNGIPITDKSQYLRWAE